MILVLEAEINVGIQVYVEKRPTFNKNWIKSHVS